MANNVITNHFLKTKFFCLNEQKITTAIGRFNVSFGNLSAVDVTMLQEFFDHKPLDVWSAINNMEAYVMQQMLAK